MSTLYVDQILALDQVNLPDNLKNITASTVLSYNAISQVILYAKNISSVTKLSTGSIRANRIKPAKTTAYAAVCSGVCGVGWNAFRTNPEGTNAITVISYANNASPTDAIRLSLICMGDE